MKAISHMNLAQSAYPMAELVSTKLESLAQKVTSCMPAYFSNYSKARALVIFTISLAAIYALYAYARSHKSDKACELPLKKLREVTSVQVVRATSPAEVDSDDDISKEFVPMLPPDLYQAQAAARDLIMRSPSPPPEDSDPIPDSEKEFVQGINAASTPARPLRAPFRATEESMSPPQSPFNYQADSVGR